MAVKKTYEVVGSKNMLTRHMTFMVEVPQGDGKVIVPRSVTLKGHIRPKRTKGRLTTSEPALIKAIDQRIENAGMNTGIICIREVKIPDSEVEKTPRIVKTKGGETRFITEVSSVEVVKVLSPDENPEEKSEEEKPVAPSPIVKPVKEVTGVSKVQEAKAWLLKNIDGLTTREVSNKEMITRVAADNNIRFIDLQ